MHFREFLKTSADLLLPRLCISCGRRLSINEEDLCSTCYSGMERLTSSRCVICARPLEKTGLCQDCRNHSPYFDKIWSIFTYKEPVSSLIHYFKYKGYMHIINFLKPFIKKEIYHLKNAGIKEIFPVPMHRSKLKEREYNHSLLVASFIGEILKVDINDALTVKRYYLPQANIKLKDTRKTNVRGAFSLEAKPRDTVLIVDDVVTTGSTVNEISRLLKNKGAGKTIVFSLARTPN